MRWVVIRITGDIVKLLELAEVTGSREELLERIQYLNKWGEGYGVHINVEMLIIKVDLEELEADNEPTAQTFRRTQHLQAR
jgi:hypothetical protein